MDCPVCMACREPLGHLAVMGVTESKGTWDTRESLDLRDHLEQKERKGKRETLGHLAVMDMTEPKETRAARGNLDLRGHVEPRERKEQRALSAQKESVGTKVTVAPLSWLHI